MGRKPVHKLSYKKNSLIKEIPSSHCNKVGSGITTSIDTEEYQKSNPFLYN